MFFMTPFAAEWPAYWAGISPVERIQSSIIEPFQELLLQVARRSE